jgi:hypothetical protein
MLPAIIIGTFASAIGARILLIAFFWKVGYDSSPLASSLTMAL